MATAMAVAAHGESMTYDRASAVNTLRAELRRKVGHAWKARHVRQTILTKPFVKVLELNYDISGIRLREGDGIDAIVHIIDQKFLYNTGIWIRSNGRVIDYDVCKYITIKSDHDEHHTWLIHKWNRGFQIYYKTRGKWTALVTQAAAQRASEIIGKAWLRCYFDPDYTVCRRRITSWADEAIE